MSRAGQYAEDSQPSMLRSLSADPPNVARWQLLTAVMPMAAIVAQRMAQSISIVPAANQTTFDPADPAWRLPQPDGYGSGGSMWGGVPDELIPDGLLINESDYVSEMKAVPYAIFVDGSVARLDGTEWVEEFPPTGTVQVYRTNTEVARLTATFVTPPSTTSQSTERAFPMAQDADLSYISEIMWPTTGWLIYRTTAVAPETRLDGRAIWLETPFSPKTPIEDPGATLETEPTIRIQPLDPFRDVFFVDPVALFPGSTKVIVSRIDPERAGVPTDTGTVWISYTPPLT